MKKLIIYTSLLLSSCQVGQYYTAKTLEKGEKQILLGGESYLYIAPSAIANNSVKEALLYSIPLFPSLDFNFGTSKKIDHTIGLSLSGQVSYATKFQFIGSKESKFSMVIRPQLGAGLYPYTGNEFQLWSKIPLILTKEFGKKSSITISPGLTFLLPSRYVVGDNPQTTMFFTSFTYHIGKKNRFFLSYSFMNVKYSSVKSIVNISTQLAIGYIWRWKKKDKKSNSSI